MVVKQQFVVTSLPGVWLAVDCDWAFNLKNMEKMNLILFQVFTFFLTNSGLLYLNKKEAYKK